jgi:23S rRNA pseudouridine1911/1915/1917 synthase
MNIIYQDNDLLIVNKEAGQRVQADKSGEPCLLDMVAEKLGSKAFVGLTHRIDQPASGIVLLALNADTQLKLNRLFRVRKVKKTYWAVVSQKPKLSEAKLENFILHDQRLNKSFITTADRQDALKAELTYKVIAESDRYFLLEIDLLTGRHHQIRCQLAAIGCPIKGDLKYGAKRSNVGGGIHLHSREISFRHPVSYQTFSIVAPVPNENLWQFFEKAI